MNGLGLVDLEQFKRLIQLLAQSQNGGLANQSSTNSNSKVEMPIFSNQGATANNIKSAASSSAGSSESGGALAGGAQEFTNEADIKNKNADAIKKMDNETQTALKKEIKKGASGTDFNKVAKDLKKQGIHTEMKRSNKHINGGSNGDQGKGTAYLEITDKSGKKFKIWDANGNATLEEADFKGVSGMQGLANDIKSQGGKNVNATEGSEGTQSATADATQQPQQTQQAAENKTNATNEENPSEELIQKYMPQCKYVRSDAVNKAKQELKDQKLMKEYFKALHTIANSN